MPDLQIPRTSSTHDYQLLIKNLLFCPVVDEPEQEIVGAALGRRLAAHR